MDFRPERRKKSRRLFCLYLVANKSIATIIAKQKKVFRKVQKTSPDMLCIPYPKERVVVLRALSHFTLSLSASLRHGAQVALRAQLFNCAGPDKLALDARVCVPSVHVWRRPVLRNASELGSKLLIGVGSSRSGGSSKARVFFPVLVPSSSARQLSPPPLLFCIRDALYSVGLGGINFWQPALFL